MAEETQSGFVQTIGIITKPHTVRIAQALGLTLTAVHAGQVAGATFNALPAILQSPAALLLKQWHVIAGESGEPRISSLGFGASSGIVGGLIAGWCATREPASNTVSFTFFTSATLFFFSTVPYTYFCVRPTVNAIKSRITPSSTTSSPSDAIMSSGYMAVDKVSDDDKRRATFSQFITSVRTDQPEDLSEHRLVDRWGWWNLGHAALLALGALSLTGAVVSEDVSIFA